MARSTAEANAKGRSLSTGYHEVSRWMPGERSRVSQSKLPQNGASGLGFDEVSG